MNEVAVVQKGDVIQQVDMNTITEYLDTTGLTKSLLPNEKSMFVNMARDFGLNPFKREIYCNVYGEGKYRKCSIVTGYEVYIKRAERTGKLDGWSVAISGSVKDGSLAATVTIHRKDWSHPFQHTAYHVECVQKSNATGQPNVIWSKMPIFMTKKVAIAQAFRLCFSDEFGGMPYTNDEMGVDGVPERSIEAEVVHVETVQPEEPDDDRKSLEKILEDYGDYLKGKPYDLSCCALSDNDPAKISEMLGRCRAYLGKKGIKVA